MARFLSCNKFADLINNIKYDPNLVDYKHDILSHDAIKTLLDQKNQFCYLYDFHTQVITYISDTFKLFLDEKVHTKLCLKQIYRLIHPHDRNTVVAITEQVLIKATSKETDNIRDLLFCIDFRMKKTDGTYIRVLRQTYIFNQDRLGNILYCISVYTDITNLKKNNTIEAYYYNHVLLENIPIDIKPRKPVQIFHFTPQENKVLLKLTEGKDSHTIAEELNISFHTVASHRKNMMQKTNTHTVLALLRYAQKEG